MQNLSLIGALALVLAAPVAGAETTTRSTTTTTVDPTAPGYSSSRTQQRVDSYGNVIEKTETYESESPVTGDSRSRSSTTVVAPDGSKSTVEQERTSDMSYDGETTVKKRSTTTTVEK